MSAPRLIANARILDPGAQSDFLGWVMIVNGRIADLGEGPPPDFAGHEQIDATGLVLAPGLIDMRVFVGEPGHEYRETLASAADAAAAGGVTSFLCMPDTQPVIDDGALVDYLRRRAEATACINIYPTAAMTRGLEGKELTEYGLLAEAGAIALAQGRGAIADSGVLRAAFTYAANFGLPVLHQPLDAALAAGGVMNEGLLATTLGLRGIPAEAETIPLERDLQLAALTGVRYHAAQISTARAIDILARHRAGNKNVSAGVSINNLALNENDIGPYRTFFKLSPPLRSEDDRQALIEALKTGVIDTIHSDHDPQDTEGKRQPFAEAAIGAIGLETLLPAALRLVHSGDVPLMTILRALTARPAELLGLEAGRVQKGAPADLILIDLDYPFVVEEDALKSRSRNSCFEGARLSGKVMRTFVAGREVFRHTEKE